EPDLLRRIIDRELDAGRPRVEHRNAARHNEFSRIEIAHLGRVRHGPRRARQELSNTRLSPRVLHCNARPKKLWRRMRRPHVLRRNPRAVWDALLQEALGQYLSLARSLVAVCARLEAKSVMMDLANYSATETLRDGRTVEIRAQRSQDQEGMHAAIARFSSGSLHRRFFAVRREFSQKETDYFLDIDFINHVALVAVANDAGQPTIVGGGRYVVVQPGQAEVAFAIIDAYQGLGACPRNSGILVAAAARIGFCLLMSKTFRPWTIDQPLLLPARVQDFVGEDHLARFVLALVLEHLDLREIEAAYASERGQPPFDPAMMTGLLLYAYCNGVYSSRRIAKAARERVDFMSIVGLDPPDFRTVSDFRKRHVKALAGLFGQVLKLCEQAGLAKLGHVALDGTKIKANASKHKAMSYERMGKRAAELEAEVESWLSAAEAADAEEDKAFGRDKSGEELPKWVADKKKRAEKIRAAKAELEAEAKAAAAVTAKVEAEAEERRRAEGRKK